MRQIYQSDSFDEILACNYRINRLYRKDRKSDMS